MAQSMNYQTNEVLIDCLVNYGIDFDQVASDHISKHRKTIIEQLEVDIVDWEPKRFDKCLQFMQTLQTIAPAAKRQELLKEIVEQVCLPILCRKHWRSAFTIQHRLALQLHRETITLLLKSCWHRYSFTILHDAVMQQVFDSFYFYIDEMKGKHNSDECNGIHITTCMEILSRVLHWQGMEKDFMIPSFTKWNDDMVACLLECLRYGNKDTMKDIIFKLLPKLLPLVEDLSSKLTDIWMLIHHLHRTELNDHDERNEWTVFMILCAFSHHYLAFGDGACQLFNDDLWKIIQFGLADRNSINRKRAVYLMRYAIDKLANEEFDVNIDRKVCRFRWISKQKHEKMSVWENYILIMQTLEETQIHIFKPVLSLLKDLVKAACPNSEGYQELHTSWLITIYKRMFLHDSKLLVKWAVLNYLTATSRDENGKEVVYMAKYFVAEFFFDDVFRILNNFACYIRDNESSRGQLPSVAVAFASFMPTCIDYLQTADDKVKFLNQLLDAARKQRLGPYPMLHFSYALTKLQPYPAWRQNSLSIISKMLVDCITTYPTLTRAAVQCFMIEAMLNMVDMQNVTLGEIANCLTVYRMEESLARGNSMWLKVCRWLGETFCHSGTSYSDSSLETPKDNDYAVVVLGQAITNLLSLSDTEQEKNTNFAHSGSMLSPHALGKIIVLIVDYASQVQLNDKKSDRYRSLPLQTLLQPVVDFINHMKNRAYVSEKKITNVMELLFSILSEMNLDSAMVNIPPYSSVNEQVRLILQPVIDIIFQYIRLQLSDRGYQISKFENSQLFLKTLDELVKLVLNRCTSSEVLSCITCMMSELTLSSLNALSNLETMEQIPLDTISQIMAMAWICQVMSEILTNKLARNHQIDRTVSSITEFIPKMHLVLQFNKTYLAVNLKEEQSHWSMLTSTFIKCQWQCIVFYLELIANNNGNEAFTNWSKSSSTIICGRTPANLLKDAIEIMDIAPIAATAPVLQTIRLLIPMVFETDQSICIGAIDCFWQHVMYCKERHINFWRTLSHFIITILQPYLIDSIRLDSVNALINDYVTKLLDMGENQQGISNALLNHFTSIWITMLSRIRMDSACKNLSNFVKYLLLQASIHGCNYRRDIMLTQETSYFIRSLGDTFPVNQIFPLTEDRCNYLVRVQAINMLCRLSADDAVDRIFAQELILQLLEMDEELRQVNKRSFSNSLACLKRCRIWQIVMVLMPFVDDSFSNIFLNKSLELLHNQNQPSVRRMIEWSSILILLKTKLYPILWMHYSKADNVSSLCSFLGIITHISLAIISEDQELFITDAIPLIIPLALANNFGIRCFAQAALKKIWHNCHLSNLKPILDRFSVVELMLNDKSGSVGEPTKQRRKILDNFYFSKFNPIKHYSLQSIFESLPRLTLLSDEEWISPSAFARVDPSLWSTKRHIAIFNEDSSLEDCQPGNFKTNKSNKVAASNFTDDFRPPDNVQQKITPWKIFPTDNEGQLDNYQSSIAIDDSRREDGLIVVASLIDKAANLGGLCRTCEIMGVSRLVLNNSSIIDTGEFQGLSVTAHKWVPTDEVRVHDLANYLSSMKELGYDIVGLEQTCNSVLVTEYKFAKKTIVLLGNEREGIPVELLQVVDKSVAIPQLGIIRSLNVHVSGAILIWEYSKQHRFSKSA